MIQSTGVYHASNSVEVKAGGIIQTQYLEF